MLKLPAHDHPVRPLFDAKDLIHWREFLGFRETLHNAREFLRHDPAARTIQALCLRDDGRIWLIQVGRLGGWRLLWDFGYPLARG